jgi:hypothetical protein
MLQAAAILSTDSLSCTGNSRVVYPRCRGIGLICPGDRKKNKEKQKVQE